MQGDKVNGCSLFKNFCAPVNACLFSSSGFA